MRQKNQTLGLVAGPTDTIDREVVHFRLCHICFHLNEAQAEVIQCDKCHRVFGMGGWEESEDDDDMDASDESGTAAAAAAAAMDAADEEEELMRLPMPNRKTYSRVHGLSVLW